MIDFTQTTETKPRVNLSALIDVAFILVIFIVLTASFQERRSIDLELPQKDGPADPLHQGLEVTVLAGGAIRIDGQTIAAPDVLGALRSRAGAFERLILLADRSASMQAAVDVLSMAEQAGFDSVDILTRRKDGG